MMQSYYFFKALSKHWCPGSPLASKDDNVVNLICRSTWICLEICQGFSTTTLLFFNCFTLLSTFRSVYYIPMGWKPLDNTVMDSRNNNIRTSGDELVPWRFSMFSTVFLPNPQTSLYTSLSYECSVWRSTQKLSLPFLHF